MVAMTMMIPRRKKTDVTAFIFKLIMICNNPGGVGAWVLSPNKC